MTNKQKQQLIEDKTRLLLTKAEYALKWTKEELNYVDAESNTFISTVQALTLIEELKDLLGYKEPEGTKLKQIPIKF